MVVQVWWDRSNGKWAVASSGVVSALVDRVEIEGPSRTRIFRDAHDPTAKTLPSGWIETEGELDVLEEVKGMKVAVVKHRGQDRLSKP
jgi:hypothetical protein